MRLVSHLSAYVYASPYVCLRAYAVSVREIVHADRQAAQPASESEQARNQPTNERMHERTNEETKTTRQSQSVRQTVEECSY